MPPAQAGLLADGVLVLHAAFVLFVALGPVLVWSGHALGRWPWVDRTGFRLTHGAAIALVVAESWLGLDCPLTILERVLRSQAGEASWPTDQGFMASWLSWLLYYDAPSAVFTLGYSLFALLVLYTAWRFPIRRS